jgi:hypothetical protein
MRPKSLAGLSCVIALALVASTAEAQVSAASDTTAAAVFDTSYVTYGDEIFSLPLGIGLRVPTYDRVDGLSIPWGPHIRVPGGRIELDPIVTYRTNIGRRVDPSISGTIRFGHFDQIDFWGGWGTFTNDDWIRSDLLNSLAAIGVGSDSRNYFRGDRIRGEFSHRVVNGAMTITPSVGFQTEFDWSTGRHERHDEAPWSFFGRKDTLRMRRVNPEVGRGRLTSALASVAVAYEADELTGRVKVTAEHAFDSPLFFFSDGDASDKYTQVTVDAKAVFPTFGMQTFEFKGHGVTTTGGDAPPQRFAYLGGAGTLATVDLLAFGGDRLMYVQGEYNYPLVRPLLPLVGPPVLSLRYAAGSAGRAELPDLIQNIGVGVGLKLVKFEYQIDPNYTETPVTHKHAFSVSVSIDF